MIVAPLFMPVCAQALFRNGLRDATIYAQLSDGALTAVCSAAAGGAIPRRRYPWDPPILCKCVISCWGVSERFSELAPQR